MKEKDFNQLLKNAVDDFEANGDVLYDEEKVWQNIEVKKRKNRFNFIKVAAIIFLFISIGFLLNYSNQPETGLKKVHKSSITPKLDSLENINEEKSENLIQARENYFANKKKIEKEVEIIKFENKIVEAETIDTKNEKHLIVKEKLSITEPSKTTAEIIYGIEFKRGKSTEKPENNPKEEALVISFKKSKKTLMKLDTNTVMANSNTTNNIYKLKF